MYLVRHRDARTPTAYRLMVTDLLHFEVRRRSLNVVLSDVVRRVFL